MFSKEIVVTIQIQFQVCLQIGADELKQVKINVKMSIFLQFLLYLFMWCHFNGM